MGALPFDRMVDQSHPGYAKSAVGPGRWVYQLAASGAAPGTPRAQNWCGAADAYGGLRPPSESWVGQKRHVGDERPR